MRRRRWKWSEMCWHEITTLSNRFHINEEIKCALWFTYKKMKKKQRKNEIDIVHDFPIKHKRSSEYIVVERWSLYHRYTSSCCWLISKFYSSICWRLLWYPYKRRSFNDVDFIKFERHTMHGWRTTGKCTKALQ